MIRCAGVAKQLKNRDIHPFLRIWCISLINLSSDTPECRFSHKYSHFEQRWVYYSNNNLIKYTLAV